MRYRPGYTEADVRDAVSNSRSLAGALGRLGLRAAGGNYNTLRKLIAHYGISTDHLDPNWARRARRAPRRIPLADILVEGSTYTRNKLKQRLYEAGLKTRRCELCGQGETWRGERMALILDHINGVADDNRLDNLRIVCPNCAATFDTHCGRQNRITRFRAAACTVAGSSCPGPPNSDTAVSSAASTARAAGSPSPRPGRLSGRPTSS